MTPMLRQYFELKEAHPEAILFFRMGDFYEMFFDDARVAAPILDVVLTSRDKNRDDPIPMCGVPHHAWESYAARLLRAGHKVAICEQMEDPAQAKGLVRRDVIRVLTPATALELEADEGGEGGNHLVALFRTETGLALACADLSVGAFEVTLFPAGGENELRHEWYRRAPREVLATPEDKTTVEGWMERFPELPQATLTLRDRHDWNVPENRQRLCRHLGVTHLEGLGLEDRPAGLVAAGVLLGYLQEVRKGDVRNLSRLKVVHVEDRLALDAVSLRNLEVVRNLRTQSTRGALLGAVDMTVTAMGRRLMADWLSRPLLQVKAINHRLDGVEALAGNLIIRSGVREHLKGMGDLARLESRVSLGVAGPTHLLVLVRTLRQIPNLINLLQPLGADVLREIAGRLDPLPELVDLLQRAINPQASGQVGEGQVIQEGFHAQLDEWRSLRQGVRTILARIEQEEREKTGIGNLKVKYNRVFGYFIEVTRAQSHLVPERYQRRQTLVNAERYITEELKELETRILSAEERIATLEKELFEGVLAAVRQKGVVLANNAELLATLDVLSSGAEVAGRRGHVRPVLHVGEGLEIREGRHPVLEEGMGQHFVPNDLLMDGRERQIMIITGPNMGGKSTYLRQSALLIILAQAGFFVPAQSARIPVFDRIFTRIGASDSLIEGKSTFLVEMIETAQILNGATSRSLILLDEVGRGTSTYDGLSIAWAAVEYLHGLKERPLTLFATHYHELTGLAEDLDRVINTHITVREWQEQVIFLHRIAEGACDQSFGIHVARIAGVPPAVVERAKTILLALHEKSMGQSGGLAVSTQTGSHRERQGVLFGEEPEKKRYRDIYRRVKDLDLSRTTPLEAMTLLFQIQGILREGDS